MLNKRIIKLLCVAIILASVSVSLVLVAWADEASEPPSTVRITTAQSARFDVTAAPSERELFAAIQNYDQQILTETLIALSPPPTVQPTEPVQYTPPRSTPAATPSECDGKVIPAYILQRESGCSYDAYNAGGCGGYGCVGMYQFDMRHFTGWSSGYAACGDLDPWSASGQDECANRLSNGGTNLAPWGG